MVPAQTPRPVPLGELDVLRQGRSGNERTRTPRGPIRARPPVVTMTCMAKRNYLVEGGSGTGKSSVCQELRRRGYNAVDGDNELAYQGEPETGTPTEGDIRYEHHIWDVAKVRELAADTTNEVTFFCGGSRNLHKFLDLFDKVIVLDVDAETLEHRLRNRGAWGGDAQQREFILRLHATRAGVPEGTIIDTARPLSEVVDTVLKLADS